jgi:hypothetical protein
MAELAKLEDMSTDLRSHLSIEQTAKFLVITEKVSTSQSVQTLMRLYLTVYLDETEIISQCF